MNYSEALQKPAQFPPTTAIVTIIAKNYLAQARVLMDSVEAMDPHCLRVVLLVDGVEGCFDPSEENFRVVSSDTLGIPHSAWFHFKYSVLELSTGVKPFFLSWLIRTHPAIRKIVYLDPDIRLYSSLRGVEDALEDANIVLTPHLTKELDDDRQPGELQILRAGTYNLGFIGIRVTEETEKFLLWWQTHLYEHCVVDLARGFFVDQRWIDLVPGLFSGVRILRNDGYNAAYWNAAHRQISWRDGAALANGTPLYFFHFSGYDPKTPDVLSKHQNRISFAERNDLKSLCDRYRQDLFARGFDTASRWTYTHSHFHNGCMIPDVGRHLLSEAPQLLNEVKDPFSDEGFERMVDLWNATVSRSSDGSGGVTKLAYRVYRLREDVQAAMPDIFGADHVRFLEWMLSSAPHEHLLSEPLLRNVRAELEAAKLAQSSTASRDDSKNRSLPVICADLLTNGASDPLLGRITRAKNMDDVSAVNEIVEGGVKPGRLTVLARYIYESRPDLQRVFPDPQGRDAGAYLAWLLNYGWHSYGLTEEFLAPLRKNLALLRSELRFPQKLRLDAYGLALRAAYGASPFTSALRNLRKPADSAARPAPPAPAPAAATFPAAPFGANVYGYFRAEMGVGQSARNGIDALAAAGIPFTVHNLLASELSERDNSVAEFSASAHYGANLYFVNADQTSVVQSQSARSLGRHNIGFWTWELDELPRAWDQAFGAYDEIWVPSHFCQAAIAARSPVPVMRVPYCVSPPIPSDKQRTDFGIGSDKFVFVTIFDMRSCFDRKNPLAVIHAFKTAFPNPGNCELIVKVNHADSAPDKMKLLRVEAAGSAVRLIEETFRYEDVAALIRASDCVVSLHRSEGFGLVMGEAMLLDKPVIATGYSGNLDFTTPSTSFVVSYELQAVGMGNAPYPPSCLWADPSVIDAAEQMKLVYENPSLREKKAKAGRQLMEDHFSPAAIGAAMKARLHFIEQRRK